MRLGADLSPCGTYASISFSPADKILSPFAKAEQPSLGDFIPAFHAASNPQFCLRLPGDRDGWAAFFLDIIHGFFHRHSNGDIHGIAMNAPDSPPYCYYHLLIQNKE